MRSGAWSGLRAALLVAMMVLGTLGVLAPTGSAALQPIIWGVVRDSRSLQPLAANVTLVEAHGGFSLGPIRAGADGVYRFSPSPGRYYLSVDNGGYFRNVTDSSFITFDGSTDVIRNVTLDPYGGTPSTLTVQTEPGARVTVIEVAHNQIVAAKPVNSTGSALFNLWSATFWLMVNKTGKETNVTPQVLAAGSNSVNVLLRDSVPVVGTVLGDDGRPITTDGVVAYLFDTDTSKPIWKRIIAGNLQGSSGFSFDAYPGTFVLIVDANGYAGKVTTIAVAGPTDQSVRLTRGSKTTISTQVVFMANWSAFRLYRNVSLADDGVVEGLPYGYLHDAQLQVALAFGNMSGVLGRAQRDLFWDRLNRSNANNMTTQGFLTFNGQTYYAANDFSAVVSPPGGPLWYRTQVTYYLLPRGSTLPQGQAKYYLNVTGHQDVSSTSTNYTYDYTINAGYERTSFSVVQGSAAVSNFITIRVDPGLPATPTAPAYAVVDLLLQKSAVGVAYWKVVGPVDRYYERNSDLVNYSVIVAQGVNITLSGASSTYPNAPNNLAFPDFNYTWRVGYGTNQVATLWGQTPTYNFTSPGTAWVNLTLTYPSGVSSSRNHTLTVDGSPPAGGSISVTFNGAATTTVDERASVTFAPQGWSDDTGIRSYNWVFGDDRSQLTSNPTSPSVAHTFGRPGTYTVSLQVKDLAGNQLANPATVVITVRDITRPTVGFLINDSQTQNVQALTEGVLYTFDASKGTSDNFDVLANLTITWDFGDGTPTRSGPTVTHAFAQYGSYTIRLVVRDRAGNTAYLNKTYSVAPDFANRPDISVKDLVISPRQPQESTFLGSSSVRVSLNVSNIGGAAARNITITVVAFLKGQSPGAPTTVTNARWTYPTNGSLTGPTLAKGETKHVEFTWTVGAAGNWTIKVNVTDSREPPQRASDDTIQTQVEVAQASWKTPALVGGIVVVIVGIPALLYARRRMRARAEEGGEEEGGERLTRRRRAERRREEEEEEK